jgi:hypothetical protein
MDIDTIYADKQGLNRAYIFFNEKNKTQAWEKILISNNIRYHKYVVLRGGVTEYGFKMLGVRRKMLTLCRHLKEVTGI